MRRSPYNWWYSAVVLSSLLAVAIGSVLQSARNLQDTVHGIPTAGETGADRLSQVRSSGAASPKAEPGDTGDPVSLLSKSLPFRPHADVKIPHPIPLPRNFSEYFDKRKGAVGTEVDHKHAHRAGSQANPPESGRRKRWTDLRMKDNKGDIANHLLPDEPGTQDNERDNADHPLPDEPGTEVHCWNEAHVFDVVLPASEVAKHFPLEYQHHLSCNTTCVAKVPGHDVCARLNSGSTEPILHAGPETQLEEAQNENKQMASLGKNFERRLGELDAKLEDKLAQISQNLNNLFETLKEQLAATSVKHLNSLDRKAAEIEFLLNKKSVSMTTAISSLFALVQSDSKTHLWTLEGYEALKANAIKTGWNWIMCQKVYIGLHLISWGIYFKNSPSGVILHLVIQLHKGISDEFLEWPFSNELKLSIIHAESGEKQEMRDKPNTLMNYFARPVNVTNEAVYFEAIKFESSHLERNGYVKNDQLLLKLEVLS